MGKQPLNPLRKELIVHLSASTPWSSSMMAFFDPDDRGGYEAAKGSEWLSYCYSEIIRFIEGFNLKFLEDDIEYGIRLKEALQKKMAKQPESDRIAYQNAIEYIGFLIDYINAGGII